MGAGNDHPCHPGPYPNREADTYNRKKELIEPLCDIQLPEQYVYFGGQVARTTPSFLQNGALLCTTAQVNHFKQ